MARWAAGLEQRYRGRRWILLAIIAFAIAARVAIIQYLSVPVFSPIKITAGNTEGLRHLLLVALSHESRKQGLSIEVVVTKGSLDACKKVNDGQVDLAFVLGGHDFAHYRRLRQVAALHVEPVQAGLKTPYDPTNGDYTPTVFTTDMITAETTRDRLPDAMFIISTLPAPVVRTLVTRFGFRLVPLPFADSFSLGALGERLDDLKDEHDGLRKEFVHDVVIPPYVYSIDPPVPDRPIHTIGLRVLLVARDDVDPEVISKVLNQIYQTNFARLVRPPLTPQDARHYAELRLHMGTLAYLRANDPVSINESVDRLEKLVTIGGPTLGGTIFLWQWLRQRSRARKNQSASRFTFRK